MRLVCKLFNQIIHKFNEYPNCSAFSHLSIYDYHSLTRELTASVTQQKNEIATLTKMIENLKFELAE